MSREDNEQIRPKKETGLRHPIGKPDYKEKNFVNQKKKKLKHLILINQKHFQEILKKKQKR